MKGKKIELVRIWKLRDKIFKGLSEYIDKTVDHLVFKRIVEICCAHLLADREIMQSCVLEHFNRTLQADAAWRLAWRLAANKSSIRRGISVSDGTAAGYLGPCIVRIVSVRPGYRKFRDGTSKFGATSVLEIQTGPGAGRTMSKFWSSAMCSRLARNGGLWPRKVPLADARTLYGGFFLVRLNPTLGRDGQLAFDALTDMSSLKARNLKLRNRRERKGFKCPVNQPPDRLPCYRCPLGEDKCPAATHAKTYQYRMCVTCNKQAFHEGPLSVRCLSCDFGSGKKHG